MIVILPDMRMAHHTLTSDLVASALLEACGVAGKPESQRWILIVHPFSKHLADELVWDLFHQNYLDWDVVVNDQFGEYEWELHGQQIVHSTGA